jgi:hypothetical protein
VEHRECGLPVKVSTSGHRGIGPSLRPARRGSRYLATLEAPARRYDVALLLIHRGVVRLRRSDPRGRSRSGKPTTTALKATSRNRLRSSYVPAVRRSGVSGRERRHSGRPGTLRHGSQRTLSSFTRRGEDLPKSFATLEHGRSGGEGCVRSARRALAPFVPCASGCPGSPHDPSARSLGLRPIPRGSRR